MRRLLKPAVPVVVALVAANSVAVAGDEGGETGRDEFAVAAARWKWRAFKAAGAETSYWQQDDSGRWENEAS